MDVDAPRILGSIYPKPWPGVCLWESVSFELSYFFPQKEKEKTDRQSGIRNLAPCQHPQNYRTSCTASKSSAIIFKHP